jgi:hypothetical protein
MPKSGTHQKIEVLKIKQDFFLLFFDIENKIVWIWNEPKWPARNFFFCGQNTRKSFDKKVYFFFSLLFHTINGNGETLLVNANSIKRTNKRIKWKKTWIYLIREQKSVFIVNNWFCDKEKNRYEFHVIDKKFVSRSNFIKLTKPPR